MDPEDGKNLPQNEKIYEPDEILAPGRAPDIFSQKQRRHERVYTFRSGGSPVLFFSGLVAGMMGLLGGAVIGAVVGLLAGPAGMLAGAVAGAGVGFLAGMLFGALAWMVIPKVIKLLVSAAALYAVLNFILTRFFDYPLWEKTLALLRPLF